MILVIMGDGQDGCARIWATKTENVQIFIQFDDLIEY